MNQEGTLSFLYEYKYIDIEFIEVAQLFRNLLYLILMEAFHAEKKSLAGLPAQECHREAGRGRAVSRAQVKEFVCFDTTSQELRKLPFTSYLESQV